jgi:hypothetical protein
MYVSQGGGSLLRQAGNYTVISAKPSLSLVDSSDLRCKTSLNLRREIGGPIPNTCANGGSISPACSPIANASVAPLALLRVFFFFFGWLAWLSGWPASSSPRLQGHRSSCCRSRTFVIGFSRLAVCLHKRGSGTFSTRDNPTALRTMGLPLRNFDNRSRRGPCRIGPSKRP